MTATTLEYQPPTTAAVSPLRELLSLAGPTVAQMASYTLMQFIDVWMLARADHSVTPPTAASNAGMIGFSCISLGMGVMFAVNALVSQDFGRGNYQRCGRLFWQGVWISVAFSLLMLPFVSFAPQIFTRAGHETVLATMEASYLRIILSAAILKLVATAGEQFLLGIDRPQIVAVATVIAVSVNALAAYLLVVHFRRGVVGSAEAQNIGVGTELLITLCVIFTSSIRRKFGSTQWQLRLGELWQLLKVGVPSGGQILSEVLAWSAFTVWVMGAFDTNTMAANGFVFKFMSVSFMPAFGMSVAVTALVGRYAGMGRPDIARARANLGFQVAAAYMLFCGVLLFVFRSSLIGLFTDNTAVIVMGRKLLIFAAIYQLFDALYIVYNGALRGVGDTLIPATVTGILCWSITVGVGRWIAVHHPALGPTGPWIAAMCYGTILGGYIYARFARSTLTVTNPQPTQSHVQPD